MDPTFLDSSDHDLDLLESIPHFEFSAFKDRELELLLQSTVNEHEAVSEGEEKKKAVQALSSEHNYSLFEEPTSSLEMSMYEDVSFSRDINDVSWSEQDGCQSQTEDNWVDELLNPIRRKEADYSLSEPEETASSPVSSVSLISTVSINQPSSVPEIVNIPSPDSTDPSANSRKRKASGNSDFGDANSACSNSKNAIAARENRLKKKQYVVDLEKRNDELEKENNLVQDRAKEQEDRIQELEERNSYLENVLHNDSALSSLLGNLQPMPGVRLTIASLGGRKKRRGGGGSNEVIQSMSKGVCLHVDGQTASLELCSHCAIMAKGGST